MRAMRARTGILAATCGCIFLLIVPAVLVGSSGCRVVVRPSSQNMYPDWTFRSRGVVCWITSSGNDPVPPGTREPLRIDAMPDPPPFSSLK